jgi:acyl-CoA synthetase (AMP-forming)/AMP-acid ligase II
MRLPLVTRIEAAATLARRGVLAPDRPDRMLELGLLLWRWGSTIATAYMAGATRSPNQLAVIDDSGTLTYEQIDSRTNAIARGLSRLGVAEEDSVAILSRNSRSFIESIVACAKLGADALLLNTSFSPAEIEAVLARERPRLLVHDADFDPLLEHAAVASALPRVVSGADPGTEEARPSLEGLAASEDRSRPGAPGREGRTVILTSGTTGTPKGARLSRPPNLEPLAWFLRAVPLQPRSTYMVAAPLFHAHGYGQMVCGASLNCTLVLSHRFDPEGTLESIERHRVQALAVVPVMLKRILDLPSETRLRYDTSSLQVVLSSGSALPSELARRFMDEFGPVLYNLYGSTEVSWATIAGPGDLRAAPGTAGRPPPHTRLAILDRDGAFVPPGATGRIFVGHEMLFEGYTDNSQKRDTAGGMMTAGDLGHVDAEGRLFVDAREDDMIISGGENVYPGEVEEVLGRHPDVADVAVVGVEDEEFGQRLVAFAVPRPDADITAEALRDYARKNLARYKVPRHFELLESLPRNALGKVLKRELKAS